MADINFNALPGSLLGALPEASNDPVDLGYFGADCADGGSTCLHASARTFRLQYSAEILDTQLSKSEERVPDGNSLEC